jgi:GAF domain-containing protein
MAKIGKRGRKAQPQTRRKPLAPKKTGEARLKQQLAEALEQKAAAAEVLNVIASSPSDVQPVFETIMRNAARLCHAPIGIVTRFDGEMLHLVAAHDLNPVALELQRKRYPMRPDRSQASGRALLSRSIVRIEDVHKDKEYDKQLARVGAWRRLLTVPMLQEGRPLGVITLAWAEPGPVPEGQEQLLQMFAAQAVIAIENVRLFRELEARNRDVTEALERQTATAEILEVIASSPSDVQPVLDAVARSAATLCAATDAVIHLRDGEMLRMSAHFGQIATAQSLGDARPLSRDTISGRAVLEGRQLHIHDMQSELAEFPESAATARQVGHRTMLLTPLMREGVALGTISVRRTEVRPFTEKQIDLLNTFASQAVIAIENVRLFNETKEALERQTATAEILDVISRSPTDVQPVFDTVAAKALKLCDASSSVVMRFDGKLIHVAATCSLAPEADVAIRNAFPAPPSERGAASRSILKRAVIHIPDVTADPEYTRSGLAKAASFRSIIAVPLLRAGSPLGSIAVQRAQTRPFTDQQIALLKSFADQAVIAIENVRLFNETKEALERQTATTEILRVIATSRSDVQPVLDAVAASAARLCEAKDAVIHLREGDSLRFVAHHGEIATATQLGGIKAISRQWVAGRAALEARQIHVRDAQAEAGDFPDGAAMAQQAGYRTIFATPLMRDGITVGTIGIRRTEVRPFEDKHIALLKTFADQAVIAIENVRLFKELQAQTQALTRSVGQLTALGEVGRAVSSTLDLDKVLKTIVSRAVQLTGVDGGTIYEFDEARGEFELRASENMSEELVQTYRSMPIRVGEGTVGRAAAARAPVQVEDIQDPSYQTRYRDLLIRQGYRAILAVPLLRDEHIIGALTVQRKAPGPFPPEVVELLKTFATQSAMAIQNARLFREIAEKGKQLEQASQHKSQFLASMSHELRTPLNAILGFNEMILDQVYGEVSADVKAPLENMQASGKHLLRLINNVLDLAKIEAGRMELALGDYAVQDVVASVHATLKPLAADKGLEFLAYVPSDIPLAYGDSGRIAQCLMNLAGNSLKFTKSGRVEIAAELNGESLLRYRVADTGIGIPQDKIGALFTEFKQTDATIASEYGGTGLGLSITKKFIEMHGGRIWVESVPGKGSTFLFEIPLRVAQ